MFGVGKLEHAHLKVQNVDDAVAFYKNVMDMVELVRKDGVVYLGCGLDEYYDLAVSNGGSGVSHFAIQIGDDESLAAYEETLENHGVDITRTDGQEPGQRSGIKFAIPSGATMELVVTENDETGYSRATTVPAGTNFGPLDIDHITLASTRVEDDATFLQDVLGWNISDVSLNQNDEWVAAFTRYGDYHHDVGIIRSDNEDATLNHLGWNFASIDHMKLFADNLTSSGHQLELGISRHYMGDNLYAYFREPGGNRFELTSEMATIDSSTPTEFHDGGRKDLFSAWGGSIDASFSDET